MKKQQVLISFIIFFFFFIIISYDKASSAEFEISSTTYLQLRENARGDDFAPFYEYLDIEIKNIREGRFNFYSAGWIRYDLRDLRDDERERDELTYAYISYEPLADRRLTLNIGRHLVFGGVASEQIDGISARWEIMPSIGISAYGGVPVETEDDGRDSDLIYGGRISYRFINKAELGISYLKEDNDSKRYREEIGFDLWGMPFALLEVQGQSFYNNITDGWMEHSYNLRLFPVRQFTMSALFSKTDYNDTFSTATMSAFSPDFLGANEKMTKAGGAVEYAFNKVALSADYKRYNYETLGDADYFGGMLSATLYKIKTGISLHRMDGAGEKLKYTESRAYAMRNFGRIDASLDAINIHYDKEISGTSNAYSVNGTLSYKLMDYLSGTFNIDYGKNPDFEREVKALFKIVLNFKK